jgi:hypothetical protein
MSSLTIPSAAAAALPAMNVHPHGHGHKKGSQLDLSDLSADSTSSSTAAQVPVTSAQNLFSKAFTALEQLVGLQPPSVASSPAAAPNTGSAASAATVNPKINVMA